MAINANATTLNANWNADDVALNYIYPTLDEISVLIPGVTINPDVSVEVGGANAYFYKEGDVTVTDGNAGRFFNTANASNYRVDIPLNQSFQIDEFIPDAAIESIGVDIVAPYLIRATKSMGNSWGKKGLAKMISGGTPLSATATPMTANTAYTTIIDAITTFDTQTANLNRAEGANYILVTPAVLGMLRKSPEYLGTSATAGILKDGIVGQLGGLTVLLSKQLSTLNGTNTITGYSNVSGLEFVLGSYDAFAAPVIFRKFRVMPTELAFGVKVQAEVPYGFHVIEATRILWRANVATAS